MKKDAKMKKVVKKKKRLAPGKIPQHIADQLDPSKGLWLIIKELARIACALDTGVDLAFHQPFAIDFVSKVKEADSEFQDHQLREIEERRIWTFTEALAKIYRLARSEKWAKVKLAEEIAKLAELYEMTFQITTDEIEKLSDLPAQNKYDDTRGPKELAVLKVSDLLEVRKSMLYEIFNSQKAYLGRKSTGVQFVDFSMQEDFARMVNDGLGLNLCIKDNSNNK